MIDQKQIQIIQISRQNDRFTIKITTNFSTKCQIPLVSPERNNKHRAIHPPVAYKPPRSEFMGGNERKLFPGNKGNLFSVRRSAESVRARAGRQPGMD